MNKCGLWILDSQIWYVITIMLAGIAFFLLPLFVSSLISMKYEYPRGVEEYLVSQRFNNCFGDPIEWNAFTQEKLDHCYPVAEKSSTFAYKVTLQAEGELSYTTKNWNNAISTKKKVLPVKVFKNNQIIGGQLSIEVQE